MTTSNNNKNYVLVSIQHTNLSLKHSEQKSIESFQKKNIFFYTLLCSVKFFSSYFSFQKLFQSKNEKKSTKWKMENHILEVQVFRKINQIISKGENRKVLYNIFTFKYRFFFHSFRKYVV